MVRYRPKSHMERRHSSGDIYRLSANWNYPSLNQRDMTAIIRQFASKRAKKITGNTSLITWVDMTTCVQLMDEYANQRTKELQKRVKELEEGISQSIKDIDQSINQVIEL